MKNQLCFCFSVMACCLIPAFSGAQTADTSPSAVQSAVEAGRKKIEALGVAVSVIEKGQKPKTYVAGERAPGKPMKPEVVFQIGSVSKIYTATLIMDLVKSKKLKLEDTLDQWYPDVPNAKQMTIRQLLNHTSGMEDLFQRKGFAQGLYFNPSKKWDVDELIAKVGDASFAPGEKWGYSSSGYLALTGVIEKVSGQHYDKVLETRILKPLELKKTFGSSTQTIDAPKAHAMIDINGDGKENDLSSILPSSGFLTAYSGAGGLVADAEDVAKFLWALTHDELVDYQSMTKWTERPDKNHHGLGLLKTKIAGSDVIGHRGNSGGFSCSAWYLPGRDQVIVVCTNKNGIHVKPVVELVIKALEKQ